MTKQNKDKKLANPFVIGRYAGPKYFCDREEQLNYIEKSIRNGRDIAIISPRRMGKSGLIEHFFYQKEVKDEYMTIFVDAYATSTISELVAMLGHAIFQAITKEKDSPWQRFVEGLKSLRPSISFDANTGVPSLSLTAVNVSQPELTLSEIFSYLDSAPRPVIIAIDEFQEISKYKGGKAEALLRGYIQRSPRTRFIFAGSEQSIMSAMFNSVKRPFYQSCITMHLPAIPEDAYVNFALSKFSEYGKMGDEGVIRDVYSKMSGITWFVQMMLNELFALTPEKGQLNHALIPIAEQNIIGIQEYAYRDLMSRLSPKQRNLAIFIAKNGTVENLMSADCLSATGFKTASSLQAAYKGLERTGLVTKMDGSIRLYDIFFSSWLRSTT
ncbi:MAG: ATP-binding protein [Lachnospiraceae bacterium]|nr:ATP-binding protein [Lachnospiraceae bacterium]